MKQYIDSLKDVVDNGFSRADRTGTGRRSVVGRQMRFNMADGFPLVTTRQIYPKAMIGELLWFINGGVNIAELHELGVGFWDRWGVTEDHVRDFVANNVPEEDRAQAYESLVADHLGSLGPIYGANWRNAPQSIAHQLWPSVAISDIPADKANMYREEYEIQASEAGKELPYTLEAFMNFRYRNTVDQLNDLIINLRDRPLSARLLVSAWIPSSIPFETVSPQDNVLLCKGALAPCHVLFQCFVKPSSDDQPSKLSLLVYIRSNDSPVGTPYNISQYALLLHMLAHVSGMVADELIYTVGDYHIYLDQLDLVKEQITRIPLPLSTVWLNPDVKSIYDFTPEDIRIDNYQSHEPINYPVSV